MTFTGLVFAYLLGGLTFIPLLLAATLLVAWYTLPAKHEGNTAPKQSDVQVEDAAENAETSADGAASGTFAVLRTYNFAAATTALNARNGQSGNAVVGTDGELDGSAGSESVYQSMYRSVFDRNKSTAAGNSVLERENALATSMEANGKAKKNVPVNIFHIVLRHGHLMLYDSSAQLQVRHVISMASHTVSLSEGGSAEDDEELKDGDLFIKRIAIVLTAIEPSNGQLQPPTSAPKPFYLFSSTCSEKEDFYHALLSTRKQPPVPIPIDHHDAIKLQSALHSTSLTQESRALNALIGRIFLALYRTDRIKSLIQRKIEKKISRIQKPAFIASLAVHSIDLGDASPILSNFKLRDLNINGDLTVSCDIRYDGGLRSADGLQKLSGGIKLTISALAKLDLGTRFKTRTVDLVLATSLQRLHGRMFFRIKPPPSNRLWFCFESLPEMDIKVEPVVSSRQITYTFVLRAIEERIRAVFVETLVKPNWDDVPFFNTMGQIVRGGIWKDEGVDPLYNRAEHEITTLASRNEKTMSMPVLVGEGDSSGASSGSETTSKVASGSSILPQESTNKLKRRSVASLPVRPSSSLEEDSAAMPPTRPPRSPSFTKATASVASVAVDDANAEQVRAQDVESPSPRKWRMRTPALPTRKEAMEAMREMRDRASRGNESKTNLSTNDDEERPERPERPKHRFSLDALNTESMPSGRRSDPSTPTSPTGSVLSAGTLRSPNRADSTVSVSSTSSNSSTNTSNQQRKTILAATAAATTAARNWSWNAIANARNAKQNGTGHARHVSAGPIGRGQPLPPPGMPLPGPQKQGIFSSLSTGNRKRKPVANTEVEGTSTERDEVKVSETEVAMDEPATTTKADPPNIMDMPIILSTDADTEFSPWQENTETPDASGFGRAPSIDTLTPEQYGSSIPRAVTPSRIPSVPGSTVARGAERTKIPPPLPARSGRLSGVPSAKSPSPTPGTGKDAETPSASLRYSPILGSNMTPTRIPSPHPSEISLASKRQSLTPSEFSSYHYSPQPPTQSQTEQDPAHIPFPTLQKNYPGHAPEETISSMPPPAPPDLADLSSGEEEGSVVAVPAPMEAEEQVEEDDGDGMSEHRDGKNVLQRVHTHESASVFDEGEAPVLGGDLGS